VPGKTKKKATTMKKFLLNTFALLALGCTAFAGNKSHVPGSRDGNYYGGTGSSHYGGHYKNLHTSDHYHDRAAEVPYN
jgi:hypothetical protein